MPDDHPIVRYGHETVSGPISITIFESFHSFVMAPAAAVLGIVATILTVYQLKRKAGMHQ